LETGVDELIAAPRDDLRSALPLTLLDPHVPLVARAARSLPLRIA
jgi:hypothetical protein